MKSIFIKNLKKMKEFAKSLSRCLREGDVIYLKGDLGVGKTTLTKFLGEFLDIKTNITSPTFGLVNTYYGKKELNHLDLYRLETPEEIETIDYNNYFYPDGITIVEWADKAMSYMPRDFIEIEILKTEHDNERYIRFNSKNYRTQEIEEYIYENFSG